MCVCACVCVCVCVCVYVVGVCVCVCVVCGCVGGWVSSAIVGQAGCPEGGRGLNDHHAKQVLQVTSRLGKTPTARRMTCPSNSWCAEVRAYRNVPNSFLLSEKLSGLSASHSDRTLCEVSHLTRLQV